MSKLEAVLATLLLCSTLSLQYILADVDRLDYMRDRQELSKLSKAYLSGCLENNVNKLVCHQRAYKYKLDYEVFLKSIDANP